jgi:hypothetical protein
VKILRATRHSLQIVARRKSLDVRYSPKATKNQNLGIYARVMAVVAASRCATFRYGGCAVMR